MNIRSIIVTGLIAGSLAFMLFFALGAVNAPNVVGFFIVFGTMAMVTIIRRFARSRVA